MSDIRITSDRNGSNGSRGASFASYVANTYSIRDSAGRLIGSIEKVPTRLSTIHPSYPDKIEECWVAFEYTESGSGRIAISQHLAKVREQVRSHFNFITPQHQQGDRR